LGVLGVVLGEVLGAGVALGVLVELPDEEDPIPVELPELVLPEPLVLPEVLPYCLTQSARSVPVLPMHWLGTAALSLLELPLAPAEPEPLELDPVVALGVLVEPPVVLLPEVCAHDALARPSNAAATAAVSVFAITMCSP
jgi:hypothetical protein